MSTYMNHPAIARDHVRRAFWAAKEGQTNVAAAHLAQALWPPKSAGVYETYSLTASMRGAATEAYEDLIAKRERTAITVLERAVYPDGIPSYELVAAKFRAHD
jgi:hypothetical protein